ncbi:hypothetical protein FSP39_018572 [Pinctada imbricata]|uniref:Metalloendopeptidase n=1 Tax=Pinctada imbricata TaxID=66713 RepID=A0AA88Y5Z1_PINIB|nr:hypothetical protein FSP39_018572 [Pinctada imbricata]
MPRNRGTVTLARECLERKTLLYYMMRILGVYDEHTRSDRDSYIAVDYSNIIDTYKPRFDKIPGNVGDTETLPYDFQSVTHYGPYAHAKNARVPTIASLVPGVAFGGQGGLSSLDAERLQILYRCRIGHPVDCDFERALCNLGDDWQDDFHWDRKDGPVSNTGPQADHSNGQGYFLYANDTSGSGGMARLISAREIPPGQYCVELYYYLIGSSDSLSIIWDDYLNHANKTLRTVTTNNGPSWSHLKFGAVSQTQWRVR